MQTFDPDLPGLWFIPGQETTYEVLADGTYHVADPEVPVAFARGGTVMAWGDMTLTRLDGIGDTVVGRWKARSSGEEWMFRGDGRYSVNWGPDQGTSGIWILSEDGDSLWTRERRATLTTTGAEVTFEPVDGPPLTYAYTVSDGVWRLMDRTTWERLAEYRRAGDATASADTPSP